ncbi:aldo/keto reductase-like protein [Phialemonium atrogriseum]|uniref:Aldo/keto reductase-like protein n=1 Tax=Phialemonium atrogriseum TaxID=1093897 RepID=A0AAJ0BQ88_9PEZI|nr:aldo/keto reductase-like protein [Phialemonium atrogriseum]KAK1762473.1 aldo/keto reductase-like protein [Phialemonium atrogriseum]
MSPLTSAAPNGSPLKPIQIPALGLGTFEAAADDAGRCARAVSHALRTGYRHIDTAAAYGCEAEVGEGIRDSGIPRGDIFLCTKFWQQWHAPEDVARSLDESLARLQTSYVDLYLMHWPLAFERTDDYEIRTREDGKPVVNEELSSNHEPTWRAMEELVRRGKTRAIGVSNFNVEQLKKLLSFARIKPVCNQVEAHPWLPQKELLEFCRENDIAFVAYSPLGSQSGPKTMHTLTARLLEDETVVEVAHRLKTGPAQVLLAWAIQRGTVAIPKSSNPKRIDDNLKVIELGKKDFDLIDQITVRDPLKRNRLVNFDTVWGVNCFGDE